MNFYRNVQQTEMMHLGLGSQGEMCPPSTPFFPAAPEGLLRAHHRGNTAGLRFWRGLVRHIFWNFQTVPSLSGKGQSSVLGHRAHGEVRGVLREGCTFAVPESVPHRRLPLTRSSVVDSAGRGSEGIPFQVRKKYLCLSPRQRRKSKQGG